jgi:hypothetical protein
METANVAVLFESLLCYMKTKIAMLANDAKPEYSCSLSCHCKYVLNSQMSNLNILFQIELVMQA